MAVNTILDEATVRTIIPLLKKAGALTAGGKPAAGPGSRTAFHFTTLGSIFISGGH